MEGTKSRVGASGGIGVSGEVKTLLLPASNLFAGLWGPASSFYSPVGLARELLPGFH